MSGESPNRLIGALRTVLITFGVGAFTFLLSRHPIGAAPEALGPGGPAIVYVVVGLALQLVLFLVHAVIERQAPDAATALQVRLAVEIIVDGITVLLFALGILGAVVSAANAI